MHKVSEKLANYTVEPHSRQVRLFRNGANQAVRIPKEFELPGKEAVMHREGNRLIIEAVQSKHPRGSSAALLTMRRMPAPLPSCSLALPRAGGWTSSERGSLSCT